jgi:hypothetical protein
MHRELARCTRAIRRAEQSKPSRRPCRGGVFLNVRRTEAGPRRVVDAQRNLGPRVEVHAHRAPSGEASTAFFSRLAITE